MPGSRPTLYRRSSTAMLFRILYWIAVVAISLALVVALILFFESRDQSSIERSALPALTTA
jgi:hypothetical protein